MSPRFAGMRSSSAMSRFTPVTSVDSRGASSRMEQRADAVGIAVERVEMAHAVPDPQRVVLM